MKISADERLAPEPKKSNRSMAVAITVVCALFLGAGWKLYQADQAKRQQAIVMAKHMAALAEIEQQERAERLALERNRRTEQAARDYQEQQAWVRRQHEESARQEQIEKALKPLKQTVFNDYNYTPKGAVNSIPPPPLSAYEPGEARNRAHVREIHRAFNGPPKHPITKTAPWSWETHSAGQGMRKGRVSGRFSYQVTNGRIDTSSVCKNEARGSIRYRDCRKGAKAYFKNQCRAGSREACTGENMSL